MAAVIFDDYFVSLINDDLFNISYGYISGSSSTYFL
jgi:hypothetical protein